MSDPVNRAKQRDAVPDEGVTTGFDVHAAAAGVLAELAPAPTVWMAADYGWDPADANAVAWAAYYSELGVDPVTLATQQAAEAAAQGAEAAEAAAIGAAGATTGTADELETDLRLEDLSFAPVDQGEPAADAAVEIPAAAAADAPDALDGGSTIWELLPEDASPSAPPFAAEFRHDLPSGWTADGARLEEFQLASGGSFDEATAPLGDLAGEQELDRFDPLDAFATELPALARDPDPHDAAPKPTPEPAPAVAVADPAPPLPDLDPDDSAASGLAVELGSLDELEAGDAIPAAAPALDLDLGASLPPPPAPALDLGWAEHAVPAGDDAVDLASFNAEPALEAEAEPAPMPELELETPAADRTAMWGLPLRAATTPPPSAAELLGDAAPLPTPAPSQPDVPLGEPIDGSLFLEPIGPAASATDPWDALPLPPSDLAVDDAPGPFDLSAPESAPPGDDAPAAGFALPAEPAEEILEVGEDVLEVPPDDVPPEPPPAEPPPASIAPPAPPAFTVEEPPAPAPVPGPAVVTSAADAPAVVSAPAAAPALEQAAFVAGEHRVVVHTADGQVKRGKLCDTALDGPELELLPQATGASEPLATDRVKAIFFMLGGAELPPPPQGKKVRVMFRDGRQVAGFSADYDPERVGFFMVPVDTRTHTARIWVYRSAVRQVAVSG